jgi:hypothetical protein
LRNLYLNWNVSLIEKSLSKSLSFFSIGNAQDSGWREKIISTTVYSPTKEKYIVNISTHQVGMKAGRESSNPSDRTTVHRKIPARNLLTVFRFFLLHENDSKAGTSRQKQGRNRGKLFTDRIISISIPCNFSGISVGIPVLLGVDVRVEAHRSLVELESADVCHPIYLGEVGQNDATRAGKSGRACAALVHFCIYWAGPPISWCCCKDTAGRSKPPSIHYRVVYLFFFCLVRYDLLTVN